MTVAAEILRPASPAATNGSRDNGSTVKKVGPQISPGKDTPRFKDHLPAANKQNPPVKETDKTTKAIGEKTDNHEKYKIDDDVISPPATTEKQVAEEDANAQTTALTTILPAQQQTPETISVTVSQTGQPDETDDAAGKNIPSAQTPGQQTSSSDNIPVNQNISGNTFAGDTIAKSGIAPAKSAQATLPGETRPSVPPKVAQATEPDMVKLTQPAILNESDPEKPVINNNVVKSDPPGTEEKTTVEKTTVEKTTVEKTSGQEQKLPVSGTTAAQGGEKNSATSNGLLQTIPAQKNAQANSANNTATAPAIAKNTPATATITPEEIPENTPGKTTEQAIGQPLQIAANSGKNGFSALETIRNVVIDKEKDHKNNGKIGGKKTDIALDGKAEGGKGPAKTSAKSSYNAQSSSGPATGQITASPKTIMPMEPGQIITDSSGRFFQLTSPQLQSGLLSVQETGQNSSQISGLTSLGKAGIPTPQTSPEMMARQISMAIQKQVAAGQESFRLTLKPAELGQLEIKMDFHRDGKIATTVIVENERTLALLQKDQGALEKALEKAGFEAGNNDLNFTLNKQQHDQRQAEFTENSNEDGEDNFFAAPVNDIISQQKMKIAYSDNALDIRI